MAAEIGTSAELPAEEIPIPIKEDEPFCVESTFVLFWRTINKFDTQQIILLFIFQFS